jgi:DNA repair exonuclease SbcCD ATPase subunit
MGHKTSRAARSRAAVRHQERSARAMKNEQSSPAARPADGKAVPDELSAGSLDKVRDILFGAQVRDADRRFVRLEERIAKESAELKEDVRKRLSALEQFVKQELDALADRLKSEHEARADADKEQSRELRETAKGIEKKFGQVDDHLARVQRELRQQLLEAQQKLGDEIQRQSQENLARLAREASDLRTEKVDRSALAAMLTELAMRLTTELSSGE